MSISKIPKKGLIEFSSHNMDIKTEHVPLCFLAIWTTENKRRKEMNNYKGYTDIKHILLIKFIAN